VTNADGLAGSTHTPMLFRRQTPAAANARGEEASASREKFFRTLNRRSRSPTPDEQDWEAGYEKDVDNT